MLTIYSGSPKLAQVRKATEFITSNQKTLLIKQQNDLQDIAESILPFFIMGFIFIALGFYAITLPTVYCTFDKNLNKVAIERKSITTHQIITYPLSSIIEVGIQPFGTKSRLVLTLISQQKILIDKFYSSSKDNVEYLVGQIKYFLCKKNLLRYTEENDASDKFHENLLNYIFSFIRSEISRAFLCPR